MRGRSSLLLTCILALFTMACAAKAPTTSYEPVPDRTYDKTKDEIWGAILEIYADLGLPIENMEKASGFIRSGSMDVSGSGYLNCGEIWVGLAHGGNVKPAEEPSATSLIQVTTLVRESESGKGFSVRIREDSKGGTYEGEQYSCEPTGQLSKDFFRQLERRLGSDNS